MLQDGNISHSPVVSASYGCEFGDDWGLLAYLLVHGALEENGINKRHFFPYKAFLHIRAR